MTNSRSQSYGLLMFVVSLTSFIVRSLVLVMGIIKRDKNQSQSEQPQASSVMRSPVVLTGFLALLCISIGLTLNSPPYSPQTLQSSDSTILMPQDLNERNQALEQRDLVKQTMEKVGYLQDIEGNWYKDRSKPKFMQLVVEIDGLRLKAIGFDFIEVKNKIEKDGSQIVPAVMASTRENIDVDSLVHAVGELLLLRHPNGDIYLKDVAMVHAQLSDEEPLKDASPFLVRFRPRY